MMSPHPLIICGKGESLAQSFIQALHHEIETVHLCLNLEDSISQVPALLAGKVPEANFTLGSDVVSKNYAEPTHAVLVGGGFADAEYQQIREATKSSRPVYWLRRDMSKTWGNPMEDWEGYCRISAERIKVKMEELKGNIPSGHEEVFY